MANLVGAVGFWARGPGPLHEKLTSALAAAIARGDLAAGARLPSERLLAKSLAVSRSTVVAAFDALERDGQIDRRRGSGTYVAAAAHKRRPAQDRSDPIRRNPIATSFVEGTGGNIEFLGAHVDGLPTVTTGHFAEIGRDIQKWLGTPGYFPMGLPPLREEVARWWTARGLPTTADEILITSGAQQAIALVAALLVNRGDVVLIETPTYISAIDVFAGQGCRFVSVPVGPDGPSPTALRHAVETHAPRLVYLVPTFQNPTGVVMSKAARAQVAAIADEHGVVVLEDEALAELAFDAREPPKPIAAHAKKGTVITVGSMSKVFWAGLRVGWVRAPAEVVRRLGRIKTVSDLGSSIPAQLVAVRLLSQYASHRADRCARIAAACDELADRLHIALPQWSFDKPRGGLCLWVRLPSGDASSFAQVAQRHGVSVVPGSLTAPDGGFTDHLRLPVSIPPDQLDEGVRRLADAWAACSPAAEPRRSAAGVLV